MLYKIAHFLRNHLPWVWDLVDLLNAALFSLRYGSRLRKVEAALLSQPVLDNKQMVYRVLPLRQVPTETLVDFFARQPEEAYRFFKPHGFDVNSIHKLQRNRAFLAYVLMDGSQVAGYCFNRSFFHGKGFRGRQVGIDYRGRGLGTLMNCLLNEIGFGIGLRLFETVNKDNLASYRSALSASHVKVLKEMEGNDLYLEILNEK